MKSLKTAIFSILCALTGITVHGMDTQPENLNQPRRTCSLGDPYPHENLLKRNIIVNEQPVGEISYADASAEIFGSSWRIISFLEIYNENFRGHGIGSQCMEQFLKDAQRDNVETLGLYSKPEAIGFYEKLGFQMINPETRYMEKQIAH